VGTVRLTAGVTVRIECGDNYRQSVGRGQGHRTAVYGMGSGNSVRACRGLRGPQAKSEPAQNEP
jgi:hypothetical protein